ncbi:MAG: dTMP kinase [bacterium]|nr:dTMP kinase [bacterium]
MNEKRGKFIVIDGCDGAGKSLMVNLLAKELPSDNFIFTREPGGTPFSEKIRNLMIDKDAIFATAETQFALAWAGRHEHMKRKILPALEAGVNVISDRFDSSTYAFQICGQEAWHLKDLFWETREVYLRDFKPDIYIMLDVEVEEGIRRISRKTEVKSHFDEREIDFHRRTKEGYFEFSKRVEHKIVDANAEPEVVKKELAGIIREITNL